MDTTRRTLPVGLGMAGAGSLLVAASLLIADDGWLVLTGTVFLVIGLVVILLGRIASAPGTSTGARDHGAADDAR